MGGPQPHSHSSPCALNHSVPTFLFCCCNVADECDNMQGSARWGGERSASLRLVNEAAPSCGRKWRKLFKRLKKSNTYMNMTGIRLGVQNSNGNEMSKSGRFQYDLLSYTLNFDDGSVDEDEHSLRAFSVRFACPIAKPRETECPLI